MPDNRLPPLASLRAFDAASRHLSLTYAAEELSITPSAVSHQIRILEDYLGVSLFERLPRKLVLTSQGARYAAYINRGFREIRNGTNEIIGSARRGILNVSTVPVFASQFLTHQLADFAEVHPSIDVRLEITHQLRDLKRDQIDVAIRYGSGDWPGLDAAKLIENSASPACHPDILAKRTVTDIDWQSERLIAVQQASDGWPAWFGHLQLDTPVTADEVWVDSLVAGIGAARDGQGWIMVPRYLIVDDLSEGRLVQPFDTSISSDQTYYLVCNPDKKRSAAVRTFSEWLQSVIAAKLENTQMNLIHR